MAIQLKTHMQVIKNTNVSRYEFLRYFEDKKIDKKS